MLREKYLWILFAVIQLFSSGRCVHQEQEILDELLNSSEYDKRTRPHDVSPMVLRANMYVLSIYNLNDNEMDYNIQIYFRQYWNDHRLSYQHHNSSLKHITVHDTALIWTPDLFFTNEKEGYFHDIMMPNRFIRIYPDGNVAYSRRLTLTLQCAMNFSRFPFDVQECPVEIESYTLTAKDMTLEWAVDPILVAENHQTTPLFSLKNYWASSELIKFSTGTYSRLLVVLKFSRDVEYYIIQIYIPCMMLAILSWTAFWIDSHKITSRVLIGLSSLLMMALLVFQMNLDFPKVSYARSIDIFTGISLTNSMLALLVTISVHFKELQHESNGKRKEINSNIEQQNETIDLEQHNKFKRFKIWISSAGKSECSRADLVSRILFPIVYFLFVISYFSICFCIRF